MGEETQEGRGISIEEIEKFTENANASESKKTVEQTEEEKKLLSEWELHMSDFIPEDISTIVIEPRREVVSDTSQLFL